MSQCIYTGALVFFEEYGSTARADLFQCGNQVLIQWMPESLEYGNEREATHRVYIGHGYHHTKRGITVVNDADCQGERR